MTKKLDEFDVAASFILQATFDYIASLEWIRAGENVCLIGPAGTGKSHRLVAMGIAAVETGHRVRYCSPAELVETLYRESRTTASAKSSTHCCATTSSSSTSWGSPRWMTPAHSCSGRRRLRETLDRYSYFDLKNPRWD